MLAHPKERCDLWSIKSSPTPTPSPCWLWYRLYKDAPPQDHPFKTIIDNWCTEIQRGREKREERRTGLHWKTERKSVQFFSHVWFFATPWTAAHQASLSITNSRSPPKPMSIELVMPSHHLFLSRPLFLLSILSTKGSLPMSQLFVSGGQNIGVPVSTSVFTMNTQNWYPLGWTGWISLQSKGLSRVFSNTTVQKHQFFGAQLFYSPNLNP